MDKEPENTTPPEQPTTAPEQPSATPNEPTQQAQTQQPQQQVFTQPQGQQQYVVMQQSLKGIGGWLIFWIIVFSLLSIGYITTFFGAMVGDQSSGEKILSLLFTPLLAIGYLSTVVLITMQKKLARIAAFVTLAVSALYSVVSAIIAYISSTDSVSSRSSSYYGTSDYDTTSYLPVLIGGILVVLVLHALVALYFVMSRRVKETLVN